MDIELFFADTKAIITTEGAYVTNLSDLHGDVLFPKRTLLTSDGLEKIRGGSHVCLPNFGPGGDSGQEQHGYARTSNWELTTSSQAAATLRLVGEGKYEGLVANLEYTVGDSSFDSRLSLENTSKSDIVVAPAFHPYFSHKGSVTINGDKEANLNDFSEAVFLTGSKQVLRTDTRLITLESEHLPTWAQWTDQLGSYICIEPTQSGFSFSEDITRAETLEPGARQSYTLRIQWS